MFSSPIQDLYLPVTACTNPIPTKSVDAVLDQYMAAVLIRHWTSPYSSLMVAILKHDGSIHHRELQES